ncbi:hypothetical protein LJR098_005227 [Rhizobium sp. LjRoot98]|uniref:hypothetical protein n=1 Tax=unclassified Rhizobium TaxID=2613769 RepID=UPI0007144633|nr:MULTISPECIES: hypothetical protein [unclassified Rhizobium]KQV30929.1 hypothetical protein ASC96_06905 [Rhizobium sp. Root1204]KQY11063.1 hypothetical protein ASD36_10260 [Rhizobium sp. Root1334]KRC05044.1 hypothetical protein ASE23_08030 [Rhizobium sp. Root73]
MKANSATAGQDDHAPLISPRFVYRLTAAVIGLATLTAAISLAGRWYGENLALAGHTTSAEPADILIGQDHLRLASNYIRFEQQRMTGRAERVDLYLTWPGLQGYTDETRALFNDINKPESLLFLDISQSTMSRDMSGRIEPIYQHLFSGTILPGPAGLVRHEMKQNSGYGQEVFFTANRDGDTPYAVRCMMPATPALSTSADCQRDIHIGRDLVVLYRFSSQLLPQWQAIDTAIATFLNDRLIP